MREGGDKVSHTGGDGTRASTYNCSHGEKDRSENLNIKPGTSNKSPKLKLAWPKIFTKFFIKVKHSDSIHEQATEN